MNGGGVMSTKQDKALLIVDSLFQTLINIFCC